MQLAGAGITANRGILGPILMMGGQMMDRNQEFKRLRSMATESAISIRGTPEEEQIQQLIRSRQIDPQRVAQLVEAGRGTQTALALPRLMAPVTEQETIPTGTWKPLPREPAGSSVYPGGSFGAARAGVEAETETVTRSRESRLDERLRRAQEMEDPAARARAIDVLTRMQAGAIDPKEQAQRTLEREYGSGRYDLTTEEGIQAFERRGAVLGVPHKEVEGYLTVAQARKAARETRRLEQLKTRHEADIEALSKRPGFKESFANELRSAVGDEKGYEARRRSVIQAIDRQATFDRQKERDEERFERTRTEKDETKRRLAASRELSYITSRMGQLDREFGLAQAYGDRQAMQQITDEMIRLQGHAAQFEAILSGQAGLPEGGPKVPGAIQYDESGNRVTQ